MRTLVALTLTVGAFACATAPRPQITPEAPPPALPGPTFEQKHSWILRLEDQRILRDPTPIAPSLAPAPPGQSSLPPTTIVAPAADLLALLTDDEARIRRRAALAVGHVGLREAVPPLLERLTDADPEVRQMAAFALGLLGDVRARDRLIAALGDEAIVVRGSAAEALGLLGDAGASDAIARMASQLVQSGADIDQGSRETPSAAGDERRDTPAAAFRLALYALVRLKAYMPLASVVLDASGQPRVRSWPVAFALQRLEDPRALPALLTLAKDADPYTRAFAVRGLGALKDRTAVPLLLQIAAGGDRGAATEAIRALGRIGDPAAAPTLVRWLQVPKADPVLKLEAASALGGIAAEGVFDVLADALADPSPAVRAAVIRSLAQFDLQRFVTLLSGLDPDPQWSVRVALAAALGTLPPEAGLPRLRTMLQDSDQRVVPSVLAALTKLRAPEAVGVLMNHLTVDDAVVRAAAAAALAELKPPGAVPALTQAYRLGERDASYVARAAALAALAAYGPTDATPVLIEALRDKDWAVRVRAAALLKQFDAATEAEIRMRPASPSLGMETYAAERLVNPPVSTQAFIDTDRGPIQIELDVLDAPLTVENFVTLARKGFFNGLTVHRVVPNFVMQTGDPRGDSEGGPGYTIRDELNQHPYLRGTVGMALDWADTGGSQFFITLSPQPHLDAKYTVFGHVVAGMNVVDQIEQGEVIRGVRIWDGEGK